MYMCFCLTIFTSAENVCIYKYIYIYIYIEREREKELYHYSMVFLLSQFVVFLFFFFTDLVSFQIPFYVLISSFGFRLKSSLLFAEDHYLNYPPCLFYTLSLSLSLCFSLSFSVSLSLSLSLSLYLSLSRSLISRVFTSRKLFCPSRDFQISFVVCCHSHTFVASTFSHFLTSVFFAILYDFFFAIRLKKSCIGYFNIHQVIALCFFCGFQPFI